MQALHQKQTRLAEMEGYPGLAPQIEESLRQMIESLTQVLAGIEQEIDELTQRHEPFQTNLVRLFALPGVDPKVVLPLLVKLYQWLNLSSSEGDAAGLMAYPGLDPQPYENGRSVRKHACISKIGYSEVRRLFYMGALDGMRGNNPLKPFYQRLVGCEQKITFVATARKILVWAWPLFSLQIDWNPDFHRIGT